MSISVLKEDTVLENVARDIAFGMKIGREKIWSALHEITIGPPERIEEKQKTLQISKVKKEIWEFSS